MLLNEEEMPARRTIVTHKPEIMLHKYIVLISVVLLAAFNATA